MIRTISLALFALILPATATAFCGFFVSGADSKLYSDASQVVLMRKGDHTVLSMSNNYKGPTKDFAMVVPVPVILQKENVKTLPPDVFQKIDQLSAPRLVEYWEQDPCWRPTPMKTMARSRGMILPASAPPRKSAASLGVKIEAKFSVGEYQILILSAEEATGLETWLRQNQYTIPDGAADALAPYVRSGMKFFVAKVDIKKVKKDDDGVVVLSPLRFDYPSKELRLPVRLGLLNANGKQDLIVYVLHPNSRFEVANYPNVFIPSNLEVEDAVRKQFGEFYVSLFDATMAKHGNKAVVTEYAWQTTSCDPCPVPPLQDSDLATLGGDVLMSLSAGTTKPGQQPVAGQPFFGSFSSWTLTRLHTRYSKKTLSEDLVFTQARPVVGGRGSAGISREKPGAVEMASVNNFQGRYIIRNYWKGKVTCDNPVWNRWGGPPSGGTKTMAMKRTSKAPRGAIKLTELVRSNVPQLSLPGKPEPTHK